MNKFLICFCSLVLIFIGGRVFPQNSEKENEQNFTDNLMITVNYHNGFNLPEDPLFTLLTKERINSIDLSLVKGTDGSNVWEQTYGYPEHGVSFFYSTLGNDEIYGREMALNYLLKIPFVIKGKFKFYNQLGIGLNYVTEKFDFEENYLNVAVGSSINLHFNCRFGLSYQLVKRFGLNGGVSFDHFSNANTAEPNLGINYLTGFAGVNLPLGESVRIEREEKQSFKRENYKRIFISVGGKHLESLSSKYYFTFASSFEFKRKLFRAFHIGVGADFFYDSSAEDQSRRNNLSYESYYDFQTGIHVSQSFVYNRFSMTLQEGIYVVLSERILGRPIYSRGIVQYELFKNISARIAMKSHLHVLDYPEFGVGYEF